jgi:ribonuclease J
MVKPKIAIPVHGEQRHLAEHGRFALEIGAQQAIVPANGDLIRLAPGTAEKTDEVPSGRLYLDGRVLLNDGDKALRERKRLSEDGLIVVTVAFDEKGKLRDRGDLFVKGVPQEDNDGEPLHDIIEEAVDNALEALPKPRRLDDREVELQVRRAIRSELAPRWGKRSDIAVIVLRV